MTSEEDRPRPAKRRRTRGQADAGKYVCVLMWARHWHGSGGGEAVEHVTDSAPSVRALFTSLLEVMLKTVPTSLVEAFGRKIARRVAENTPGLGVDELPVVADKNGGLWEVTAHRRSDLKVLAEALTLSEQCPRFVQVWENGRSLVDGNKCTCDHRGEGDVDDINQFTSTGSDVPTDSPEAPASAASAADESGVQPTETEEPKTDEANIDAPTRSTRSSARNRSKPTRSNSVSNQETPSAVHVAQSSSAHSARAANLKAMAVDVAKVKKSVGTLWKSKVESQKRKIEALKHRLTETEQNLEQFRNNWIKEKEQNEKLWMRIESMQRRFRGLTESAVATADAMNTA